MHDGVAVREGASLDVLPRDAHVVPLEQERPPRELLRQRPVDLVAAAAARHRKPLLVQLADHTVRLRREAVGVWA